MRWFKSTLAYDGAAYRGWQLQDGQLTVQQVFETGIFKIKEMKIYSYLRALRAVLHIRVQSPMFFTS